MKDELLATAETCIEPDPEMPPLPPHITLGQAKKFTSMLLKGDPEEAGLLRGTIKEVPPGGRGRPPPMTETRLFKVECSGAAMWPKSNRVPGNN